MLLYSPEVHIQLVKVLQQGVERDILTHYASAFMNLFFRLFFIIGEYRSDTQ